jgi:hypothetical protein
MAPTAPKNTSNRASPPYPQPHDRPDDETATPERREHTEPSPTTFRCRRDPDGVTVWVPSAEIDDSRGQSREA